MDMDSSNSNSRTRHLVGLGACTVAFAVLASGSELTPSWTSAWTTQTGSEYSALTIAAVYLAFDHWFSAMYCKHQHLWQVTEDAITLTVLLIVLATLGDGLEEYRTSICSWMAYKTLRLASSSLQVTAVTDKTTTDSLKSMKESASASEVDTNNNDMNNTWIIHGETYHLKDYVNQHPGGVETIMLGRGRDCTALFESYHPFTNQNKVVLKKFKDQKGGSSKTVASEKAVPQDFLYEVLKKRVAQTLKDKGIDPVADRAANSLRIFYYAVVLVGGFVSGISHLKVRSSWLAEAEG
jgi:cytochrome b involved in lipid metabolism